VTILRPENCTLLTDLYELTMGQAYLQAGQNESATFSLFVRRYPRDRGFFISAGLEDVLRYLEALHFDAGDIGYLHRTGIFSADFLGYLQGVRFTGEVWAIPEGRLFFADEPVLEVTAPMIEAQLVETYLINQVHLQSMIATKAARCVHAAQGRAVIDFALRRTQGADAGMKVARSSYLAGCVATSNVLAGKEYGLPVSGTMAHSFVSSFPSELEAFRAFARSFPDRCVLLIDTYDTIRGAHLAVQVAKEMEARGQRLQGVRIDSGDLLALSREVRRILDEAGLGYVLIVGSGGLDEYDLAELSAQGAPFASYGVGTRMGVSADAPWLDMAYKLVHYAGEPIMKLSPGKASLPGAKQVYRFRAGGRLDRDVLALRGEDVPGGEALLQPVMAEGRRLAPPPPLAEIRARCLDEISRLDESYQAIREPAHYPVTLSPRLEQLRKELEEKLSQSQ